MAAVLNVPITKSGKTVEINTDDLPDTVYQEALLQGLKVLANRGMSKITKVTYPAADELKDAAQAKALANVEDIKAGKIKFSGAKKAKTSGAVMTEARRLAKNLVKDGIKEAGGKISHYEAKEITAAANELLNDAEQGPVLVAQAEANLAERAKTPIKVNVSAIKISPKKVAAAEAKKAEKKPLSAKQAGKVAPRAKGGNKKPAPQPTA